MCEFCGCGLVKARRRPGVAAGVPVMLGAIPVKVVDPGSECTVAAPRRGRRIKDPDAERAPRSL